MQEGAHKEHLWVYCVTSFNLSNIICSMHVALAIPCLFPFLAVKL